MKKRNNKKDGQEDNYYSYCGSSDRADELASDYDRKLGPWAKQEDAFSEILICSFLFIFLIIGIILMAIPAIFLLGISIAFFAIPIYLALTNSLGWLLFIPASIIFVIIFLRVLLRYLKNL